MLNKKPFSSFEVTLQYPSELLAPPLGINSSVAIFLNFGRAGAPHLYCLGRQYLTCFLA